MSKSGNNPSADLIRDIRTEKANGRIVKRFKDDFFALDLLRILYDDTEPNYVKIELLIALEEYGHLGITDDSVDQIVTSLLDIHHQILDKGDNWPVNCQLLSTCTCLVIQFDLLNSNVKLCETLIKELVTMVTSRVNQPDSHRLTSCACQCLIHLEEFHPGLLHGYHDDISQLSKQERSHVFQDYALLAAKIMESVPSTTDQSTDNIGQMKQKDLHKQLSYEPQDIRQTVAYIVENLPLFTRSGTLRVVQSLSKLCKLLPQVSPMIFKPTMLHQMSTMSCVVFHTVLYLQKEFENEILSSSEENDLLQRLCLMCDHPCLNHLHRLLAIQWAQHYNVDKSGTVKAHRSIIQNYRSRFYPSVFDSVDCQLGKLCMTSLLGDTDDDSDGVETSILLGSLGCLHKMVWHTGSSLAAKALFKALYYIYTKHNNPSFSKDIQRFVRGLISEFAHFIPHSIDFADCVHEISSDDQVFVDTLILLHQQVVMATEEQIYESYPFYLQIMKKAASRQEIDQKPALKFLSYVVKNASYIADSGWKLGHSILDICKVIIMSHGTESCFLELGDLLHEMMCNYDDTDVQDKARFYYALITGSTDSKVQSVLQTNLRDVESMNQTITSLLPGSTDKMTLAKILKMEQPIFNWNRISITSRMNDEQVTKVTKPDMSDNAGDKTGVDVYEDIVTKLDTILEIKCSIQLRNDTEFTRVHAVSIYTEPSIDYQPLHNKHIACLTGNEKRDVCLMLRPKLPLPRTVHCIATFASDSKLTYSSVLTTFQITFCDLMMQLPWKHTDEQKLSFTELWDWVLTRKVDDRSGIESVKIFHITKHQFTDICNNKLKYYHYISDRGTDDACFVIYLPPTYHILMKCVRNCEDHIVVTMVTDLQTLLPHINQFLEDLFR